MDKTNSGQRLDHTVMEIVSSYSGFPLPRLPRPTPSHKSPRYLSKTLNSPSKLCYDSLASLSAFKSRQTSPAQKRHLRLLPYRGTHYLEAALYASLPNYPATKPVIPSSTLPNSLTFDSSFESGNLAQAIKCSDREYNLLLNHDTQTKAHTQWFYFAVRNSTITGPVTFRVINLGKRWSLFEKGLRPLVWSDNSELGWQRAGTEVTYKPSEWCEHSERYYQLTFTYSFLYSQDVVYFSHCYPYQYTQLMRDLQPLDTLKAYIRVDQLCETESHNSCPIITITEDIDSYPSWEAELALIRKSAAGRKLYRLRNKLPAVHVGKKGVILLGRAHPGETCSSFVLKGAIDFLSGPTRQAQLLRHHYLFRIVPMLNPDGVVYGNTRTSLLGVDLNRRWSNPSHLLHPTLYYAKRMIQTMKEEREIALMCDVHGHSTKKKVFLYGCKHDISSGSPQSTRKNALIRLFALLLSRNSDLFSYGRCRFAMESDRQATARQVCFRDLGIDRSYTLEASLFGPLCSGAALSASDYESIGKALCLQLLSFINRRLFKCRVREACEHLGELRGVGKVELPLQMPGNGEEVELLEMERTTEHFGLREALEGLGEFQEELNASYTSEVTDEGTESSDYSDSEDWKPASAQRNVAELEEERSVPKKQRRQLRARQMQRVRDTPKGDTLLCRSNSPLEAHNETALSASFIKPAFSRYLKLQPKKIEKRPQPPVPMEESMQAITPARFENEQLKPAEDPRVHVVVTRTAGGFRSAYRSRDPRSHMQSIPHFNRIHSSLNIERKVLWKPVGRTEQREEKRLRVDLLLNTIL